MCRVWYAESSTPPSSSKSSIRTANNVLAPPPADASEAQHEDDLAAVGALGLAPHGDDAAQYAAPREPHRSDTYLTASEIFQSPEPYREALPEITPPITTFASERASAGETYDSFGDIGARRKETIAAVLKPPDAPIVRTRRLMLSISLLSQVSVIGRIPYQGEIHFHLCFNAFVNR